MGGLYLGNSMKDRQILRSKGTQEFP